MKLLFEYFAYTLHLDLVTKSDVCLHLPTFKQFQSLSSTLNPSLSAIQSIDPDVF